MSKKPIVLIVIDGFGYSKQKIGNAAAMAKTPNLDFFKENFPHTLLQASGTAVGLEWGEPGNSEVGHLALGAGRIFRNYLPIINSSIADGSFFSKQALLDAAKNVKQKNSKFHILGLLTSGSVHAHFKHLLALVDFAKKNKIANVYLHLFTDGKDSGTRESSVLIKKLQKEIEGTDIKIASLMGRDFAMNRANDWQKTKQAYELVVNGQGNQTENFQEALENYHQSGITDESIPPAVLAGSALPLISEGDSLVFFNFREDSIRQLVRAFAEENFLFFEKQPLGGLFIATFTKYLDSPRIHHLFEPIKMENSLAEWLSLKGKTQLHIAESEKYAHVTIFFNGLENKVYDGETDLFIESPKNLADFPQMKSKEIAEKVVEELKRQHYDFVLANFANADMLAHLGNIDLVVKGIEKIDEALGLIYEEVKKQDGVLIITSDHGNAESLVYSVTGERETKHNLNPVPFYLISDKFQGPSLYNEAISGILPDVAPTILEIMELPTPAEMDGRSLISKLGT